MEARTKAGLKRRREVRRHEVHFGASDMGIVGPQVSCLTPRLQA